MSEDMKFEGILALIQTNNDNTNKLIEANHKSSLGFMKGLKGEIAELKKETKEGIDKLESYNVKQNGRQADMIKRLGAVEKNCQEKTLTCGANVLNLMQESENNKIEIKEKTVKRLTNRQWIALFTISVIMVCLAIGGFVISIINLKQ